MLACRLVGERFSLGTGIDVCLTATSPPAARCTGLCLAGGATAPRPSILPSQYNPAPTSNRCRASKFYLAKGGTAEYALDALLARVEEEHEGLGDGSFVQASSGTAFGL